MSLPERTPVEDLNLGSVDQVFLLKDCAIHETKGGSPYLRATLCDRTAQMPAIRWDTPSAPDAGLYLISGMVEEYKGSRQIKIDGDLVPVEGDLSEFLPASEIDGDRLKKILKSEISSIVGEYGEVVRSIFSDGDIWQKFTTAPAATKNHHAYRHGLAEHTLSMLDLSGKVARHYDEMYGLGTVDHELLKAGAILHDLGKIYELEAKDFSWSRQARGELVGHITEVAILIQDACLATLAGQGTRDRLIHMVLSHHGRQEWGSPVEPRFIEAMILHQIDMMDSRFAMMRRAIDGLDEGEVSGRVWALGGRVVR